MDQDGYKEDSATGGMKPIDLTDTLQQIDRDELARQREETSLLRDSTQVLSNRVTALREQVAQAREQLTANRAQLEANDATIVRLRNDLGTIASHLADQADLREWDDEYERFVKIVNGLTSEEWLYRVTPTTVFAYNVVVTARVRKAQRERLAGDIENHLELLLDSISSDYTHGTVNVQRDRERRT